MTHHDNSASGLSRPAFFDRQSLSAEDLNCLVDYIRNERRRHNRNVVGWGVTNGLPVTPDPNDPWQLVVGAGHAIAPSGQEIEVLGDIEPFNICEAARACLDIPGACPDPVTLTAGEAAPGIATNHRGFDFSTGAVGARFLNPFDLGFAQLILLNAAGSTLPSAQIKELISTRGLGLDAQTRIRFEQPINRFRLTVARSAVPPRIIALSADGNIVDAQMITAGTLTPQTLTLESTETPIVEVQVIANGEGVFLMDLAIPRDTTVIGQVYLAICPDETPACFKPGIPEHCKPPGDNVHPARICEGYRLEVLCDLPGGAALPSCDEIEPWLCEDRHIPTPQPPALDCVVLASVSVGNDGILGVDEFTDRRKLPPLWVTAAHGACCCCADEPTPTPPPPPTEISEFTFIPTIFTTFTPFTDIVATQFTTFTPFTDIVATQFTTFTHFTDIVATQFTTFTPFTDIVTTQFTTFTPFTDIVATGIGTDVFPPSGIVVDPVERTEIIGPGGASSIVVTPGGGGLEFDRDRGRELNVDALPGVGARRKEMLREKGISNLTDFIERNSEFLAQVLRMSEVKIARLQEQARAKTMEGG